MPGSLAAAKGCPAFAGEKEGNAVPGVNFIMRDVGEKLTFSLLTGEFSGCGADIQAIFLTFQGLF
jgi:hypothetical protein